MDELITKIDIWGMRADSLQYRPLSVDETGRMLLDLCRAGSELRRLQGELQRHRQQCDLCHHRNNNMRNWARDFMLGG